MKQRNECNRVQNTKGPFYHFLLQILRFEAYGPISIINRTIFWILLPFSIIFWGFILNFVFFFSFLIFFLPTQLKKHVHKILVLSYNLFHFPEDWRRTCPDTRNLLFLCSKEFHKKFATILMICERWCHSEKTKTCIAFDVAVIFTCRFF